jgi:hypothetical protein
MQGKGTEDHAKLSFLLAMCVLFALIAAGLISCIESNSKRKEQPSAQYKDGDIVYLKPDSTIGVIGSVNTMINSGIIYRIGYKNKNGVIEYHDLTETQIYSKKY